MRLRSVSLSLVCLGSTLAIACGDSGRPSGGQSNVGGSNAAGDVGFSGGTQAAGGVTLVGAGGTNDAGGTSSGGGMALGGGAGSTSLSTGGSGVDPSVCGNGTRETGEQCDSVDLGGLQCADLGFDTGALSCDSNCQLVLASCAGTERCFDGIDNDGDRDFDCADSDCAADCADSCSVTGTLDENGATEGTLKGHATELAPYCSRTPQNPEVVYAVVPTADGFIDATLLASSGATLSARYDCADDSLEATCTSSSDLEIVAYRNETLYIVVEGDASDGFGFFELSLNLRVESCGNGAREAGEECDDGNQDGGDGCDASCAIELSETESNRSVNRADEYVDPFYGEIADGSDHDYIEVVVDEPPVAFFINTFDYGDGACTDGELDSTLELIAPDGATVLAEDDDSGAGYCASIEIQFDAAQAGSYYVVVSSSPFGSVTQFPYILDVTVELCGNGVSSPGEECDDSNRLDGDGCSSICTSEW